VKKETPSKRKVVEVDSEDDDDFIRAPKIAQSSRLTPKKPAPAKPPPIKKEPVKTPTKAPAKAAPKAAKTSKKPDEEVEDAARKAILDSIETVGLPDTEPPTDGKFNFRAVAARPGPQALGSKEVPVGEEDCLTVRPRSMSIHLYSRA
jgi:replication factor C subunit 1